jgi:Rha family phage regulatory protein
MSTPNAIVITDQDHVFTTSLLVAEKFDKQHKNVLRNIETILEKCPDKEFGRLNFEPTSYIDRWNREQKIYNMRRDGFVMLASGFTGDKAFLWRIAFINAFNRMDALLREHHELLHAQQASEHQALIDALFASHPKWPLLLQAKAEGLTQVNIGKRLGMNRRNVQRMLVRIREAGLAFYPVARLPKTA